VERKVSKKGNPILDFVLEDLDGFMPGSLFGPTYTKFEALFVEDAILAVRSSVEVSDRGRKLKVNGVQILSERGDFTRNPGTLLIRDEEARLNDSEILEWFKQLVPRYPGPDSVLVRISSNGGMRTYALPIETYHVDMTSHPLHAELREVFGADSVSEE
jgi:DNA polymerase III alpha subunit